MYSRILSFPLYCCNQFHLFPSTDSPSHWRSVPKKNHLEMWRTAAKQACLRNSRSTQQFCFNPGCSSKGSSLNPFLCRTQLSEIDKCSKFGLFELGSCRKSVLAGKGEGGGRSFGEFLRNPVDGLWISDRFDGISPKMAVGARGFASVAEVEVSTDAEEDASSVGEIQMLLEQVSESSGTVREDNKDLQSKQKQKSRGMGQGKYLALRKRQVKIETEAWEQAAKEYRELLMDMCEQKLAPNLPYMKSLFLGWFEPLRDCIAQEQALCRQEKNKAAYAPYFDQLPAEMMSVITMHKLMALLMTGTDNGAALVVQAAMQVGEAIEQEDMGVHTTSATPLQASILNAIRIASNSILHERTKQIEGFCHFIREKFAKARIHRFLEKTKKNTEKDETTGEKNVAATKEQEIIRKRVKNLMKQQKLQQVRKIVKGHDNAKPWGQDAQAKVGSRLVELLIQTAYIQPPVDQSAEGPPDIRPAFRHTFRTFTREKFSRRFGVIECDPLVRKGLDRTARHTVIPYMPMLVPPLNWTGYDRGAHFFLPSYVMRTHGARQQREAVKRAPCGQLQSVYEALNTLGSTKWRVNKRVLSVVDRIWSSGGCLAGLVDREDNPLPEKPDSEDEAELKKWKWSIRSVKKQNSERHSQRCDIELKLAVARKMKDEEGFYYPHNVDFRGRAYPMHPYLNHLGSDLCRGVLEFAEGRPLGKSGIQWLKIHMANVYGGGVDKLSYDGRIAFTENHLEDIFDSADRPLEGRRWWLNAEDPFQCLATCINLSEALRSSSPETTISHMPIHQDGSCNGLQHYAALGRDKLGAAAVNLVAGEKPADVYSGIAARVLDIMRRDAQKDPTVDPNAVHARLLINQVDRKLVKQTVMTSVYGVTYIGARDQIKRRLKERGAFDDDKEQFMASCYAAKTTLTALGEMFQAARSIMSWLGECAKVIASENQSVRWTTPLGLPVVQPYKKLGRHLVKTSLQILTLQRETDQVMVKRQRTAFPPNFVHSLDGSHMMMTAISCKRAGLNFAGVHDSYWTHACDVDEMNRILREKFVELYETSILENLLESFQQSFPTAKFPQLPERGDFDLKEVLTSAYFFN